VRRETQDELVEIEMDKTNVPSLEAPMSHTMDRDMEHEEEVIPPLQDKTKS
jgi:hypothetical protein